MHPFVFKDSVIWINIGEVSIRAGIKAQALLKCAQMPAYASAPSACNEVSLL